MGSRYVYVYSYRLIYSSLQIHCKERIVGVLRSTMNWFHLGLLALMLIAGSIETMSVKWADTMHSEGSDGKLRGFRHPFLQAAGMFLGEMLCMVAFYLIKWFKKWKTKRHRSYEILYTTEEAQLLTNEEVDEATLNPLIFLPLALCDLTATSIQYIGLAFTYASSYQMLRGAIIIFTGVLSKLVLRKRQEWYRWAGIIFVIAGLVTVGLTDILYSQDKIDEAKTHNRNGFTRQKDKGINDGRTNTEILIGDILIVCSQFLVASQIVYEEKFIAKYNVEALKVVGWEGIFGFSVLCALFLPFYYIPVGDFFGDSNPRGVVEDIFDGFHQLANNSQLAGAFTITIISVAFLNFAGVSVTKEMSATTRMILGQARTIIIWGVSLIVGWEKFKMLQLFGFVIIVIGMLVYSNILIVPALQRLLSRFGLRNENSSEKDLEENNTL